MNHHPLRRATGAAIAVGFALTVAFAANHREAPITALDHKADITDVFAFVSYDGEQTPEQQPELVTLIMAVDPLLEPANGPTLFPFDPEILYQIHVDNDHDAVADRSFSFRFETEYRLPGVYTAAAGVGPSGATSPADGSLVVPPRIEDFQNPGLNQIQTYTVRLDEDGDAEGRDDEDRDDEYADDEGPDGRSNRNGVLRPLINQPLYAVPGNVGPRTMNYEALYDAAAYDMERGIRVFAGTVDDPFWIDLGAAFDTANFRTLDSGVPGVLTSAEDAAAANFASDTVSGYAVNAIAIEVPIELLTSSGQLEPADSPAASIGVWATTSRRAVTLRRPGKPLQTRGPWRQVQRMGNPLINELVIGIGSKDRFSTRAPSNDADFADFFLDPPIVKIVEALYGGALAVPEAPRFDLLPLVQYGPPLAPADTPPGPIADLLRLNTGIPATPPEMASRLGVVGGDLGGYPNGRRLFDDVVDIVLRVAVGGVLAAPFEGFVPEINGRLGDGVNVNDTGYADSFPYLGMAPDGRNRRHVDPGEMGGGPVD